MVVHSVPLTTLFDIRSVNFNGKLKNFNRFDDFSRNFNFFLEQFSKTPATFAITQRQFDKNKKSHNNLCKICW